MMKSRLVRFLLAGAGLVALVVWAFRPSDVPADFVRISSGLGEAPPP